MMTRTLPVFGLILATALFIFSADATTTVASPGASLPAVSSGARPGPDVLYAPPPTAPQLENRDPRFNAAPLLVSGTEAYVDGEYLYQDYLYDDYGSDTDGGGCAPLSPQCGDIEYPTDFGRYGGNAADIVEFRIDTAADSVAYRITLNTLIQPDTTIIAIAFDTDRNPATGVSTLPRDPGAPFPGTDQAIIAWGTAGEHLLFGGIARSIAVPVTTDLEANQMTIVVPRSVSNPSGIWRTTVAAGLFDGSTGGWLRPGPTASATAAGGAGLLDLQPSGILNLAFRFDEPVLSEDTPADTGQAAALRAKTPTRYANDIDFDALASGENSSTVPDHGTQIRIFPSRLELGEGRNLSQFPGYLGQLQPYSLYIPTTYSPGTPAGMILNLHSLSEHYWQYNGSQMVQQIGEQRGDFVATSLSRGDDGWYQREAEYDVFEMWNDIASHFTLDPDRAAISGYSMGGFATYRLGTLYPDLFGKAFTQVGPPGDGIWLPPARPTGGAETLTNSVLENTRNLPYLNLAGVVDELVPYVGPRAQNLGAPELGIDGFDQLGYRFRFITYPTGDHFILAVLDDYPMAADFLGDAYVDRNPSHVTFSYMPAMDDAGLGLVHNHAYWVSDLSVANAEALTAKGTIDVFSHAFGRGEPASTSAITPGVGPLEYVEYSRTWGAAPVVPAANRLDVTLTNLSSVTVDAARAALDTCSLVSLLINSDTASRLLLAGMPAPQAVSGADYEVSPDGLTLLVTPGQTIASIMPDCRPDLQVSALSVSSPALLQRVLVTATVVNTGIGAAPASQTELLLDGTQVIAVVNTPALEAGESAVVTAVWSIKGLKNTHTLLATANDPPAFSESNPGNNSRALTVNIQGNTIQ